MDKIDCNPTEMKISHYIDMLLESPGWKTFFSVIIPIITGILSGLLVAEISSPSGINWKIIYYTKSFYGLLTIVVIIYFYCSGSKRVEM